MSNDPLRDARELLRFHVRELVTRLVTRGELRGSGLEMYHWRQVPYHPEVVVVPRQRELVGIAAIPEDGYTPRPEYPDFGVAIRPRIHGTLLLNTIIGERELPWWVGWDYPSGEAVISIGTETVLQRGTA